MPSKGCPYLIIVIKDSWKYIINVIENETISFFFYVFSRENILKFLKLIQNYGYE